MRAPTGIGDPVPKAIIGPHAGYVYSGPVAARAYARLAGGAGHDQPRRADRPVALCRPSRAWRWTPPRPGQCPSGTVALDTEAIARLRQLPMVGELEAAYTREHALEVHVPFLQHVLGDFRLVPIVAGDAPPEAVAAVFDAVWGGPETLIVVSTDLSHYLDYAACQRIDQRTAEAIERFDIDAIDSAGACGQVPTRGLLLAARRRGMTIERLDLRNSGDTAGAARPRGRLRRLGAVRAGACRRSRMILNAIAVEALADTLIDHARAGPSRSASTPAHRRSSLPIRSLPPLLAAPGAAFVTLRRTGALRGCIGSPVALAAADRGRGAARVQRRVQRPALPAAAPDELAGLELSVSVLTPPVPMRFTDEADLLAQLRPGIDGLIIEDAGRRALFLPSVWEELPDPRQFLAHLKLKAGLPAASFLARLRGAAVPLDRGQGRHG